MHDTAAEYAIIGTALHDPGCAVKLATLPPDTFADPYAAALHRGVCSLVAKGQTVIDELTLCDACRAELPEPETYCIRATTEGFMPSMYGSYEAILSTCRKRRLLTAAASAILKAAPDPSVSPDALIAETIQSLQAAEQHNSLTATAQEAMIAFDDYLTAAETQRCYTGVADLDRLTGGIRGGKLVVIGARPGVGKSAFALAMAHHVAAHTGPVLIVSLEMDRAEIMTRLIARESGCDAELIETGAILRDECWRKRVYEAYPVISGLPLRIAEKASTPLQIRRAAMGMKNNGGISMVVVDYIQLLKADGKHGRSRYEEVSEISRELKLLAADLGVPVVALTQFNRSSEAGVDGKAKRRRPTMAEAKDSGSIEQDANIFMTLFDPDKPEDGSAYKAWQICQAQGWQLQLVTVEKNRQGRTGSFALGFDKPRMSYHNIDTRRDSLAS